MSDSLPNSKRAKGCSSCGWNNELCHFLFMGNIQLGVRFSSCRHLISLTKPIAYFLLDSQFPTVVPRCEFTNLQVHFNSVDNAKMKI